MKPQFYAGFRVLSAPIHFHTAALHRDLLLVFQEGALIGSGRIDAIKETDEYDVISINGENYLRNNCVFTYAEKREIEEHSMIEKYALAEKSDRTMFVFAKNGKFYGHIVKDRTDKAPAKIMFETDKYDSVAALKADYPEKINADG